MSTPSPRNIGPAFLSTFTPRLTARLPHPHRAQTPSLAPPSACAATPPGRSNSAVTSRRQALRLLSTGAVAALLSRAAEPAGAIDASAAAALAATTAATAATSSTTGPRRAAAALAAEESNAGGGDNDVSSAAYSTYKGPISLGFSFSYPAVWTVKKKPIRTHLSEVLVTDPADASTTAGLVVDAVKIDAIDQFGTPDAVAAKVVAVETKKENVNSARVDSARAVQDKGLTYYLLDYTVDSSRGVKRYVAKATVTAKQLYVLTAQAKVDNFSGATEQMLNNVIESFTVVKQFS